MFTSARSKATIFESLAVSVDRFARSAERQGLHPLIRPNGTSDINWENLWYYNRGDDNIFSHWPGVQFYDYSKIYVPALLEQSDEKKGSAGVDMRGTPDVFQQCSGFDFKSPVMCEVETELRALGGGAARETVVSVRCPFWPAEM